MDLGLKDKVAFIAASSKGLGKAVATELACEGARVIINGRNKDTLAQTKKEIEKISGQKVRVIEGDLSELEVRNHLIGSILKEFERVDILVTNTGGPPSGKFESFSKSDWDKAYNQLLGSAVGLCKGFIPGMKKNQWGRIIAITSMAVKQPVPNLILSNSVRASVAGLIKTLASELGSFGITANTVMPGYTDTERLQKLMEKNPDFSSNLKGVPLGRVGKPEEFAAAVAFLASERASYITGVSLAVDGGAIKNIL
jgi:3-oxoacyl-[acyl-carrier protein] reductase